MRRFLYRIYHALQGWLAPGLRPSQRAFADILEGEIAERPVWLDLGCGRRMFPEWMPDGQARALARTRWVVGADPDMQSLREHSAYPDKVLASGYELPFAPASFDLVSANMVVEHLAEPAQLLKELRRVLRPGGRFVFHTPNRNCLPIRIAAHTPEWIKLGLIRILEGRPSEDVFPTLYRFNDKADIEQLAASAGFRVIQLDLVSNAALTASLGPLAIPELLWLRLLERPGWEGHRGNIIGVLEA